MELNLQKLFSGGEKQEAGELECDFSTQDFPSFRVPKKAKVKFRAEGQNGEVLLWLLVEAEVEAECSRCLVPIQRPWRIEKEYRVTRADMEDEFPQLPYTQAGGLALCELASEELLLEVDTVLLCSEECEGLCAECGKPRHECTCVQDTVGDPRLQVLRQLLDEEETKS